MYQAKENGVQSYRFFKAGMDATRTTGRKGAGPRQPLPFHGSGESTGWKRRKAPDSSTAQVGIGVRCVRCEGKTLGCLHEEEDALVTANNEFD